MIHTQIQSYIERGWTVLPVPHDTKAIRMPWKSYQSNPPTIDEINTWFAEQTNVAIVTGRVSKLLVIDIDNPELIDEFMTKYPTDLWATTPRGGVHLFFAYPNLELGNGTGSLPAGVDVRGQGGYVLAAPSVVNGNTYTWGSYGEAAPLPANLLAMILNISVDEAVRTGIGSDNTPEGNKEQLERILRGEFTKGAHNNELFWASAYMASTGWDHTEALNALLAADRLDPTPQGAEQVISTLHSAFRNVAARGDNVIRTPILDNLPTTAVKPAPVAPTPAKPPEPEEPYLKVVGFGTYCEEFAAETRFLIDEWLPLDSVLMIAGSPGAGKTWFLLDMMLAVALGHEYDSAGFLGEFGALNAKPGKVLLFQQEDSAGKISQRLKALLQVHARNSGYETRIKFEQGELTTVIPSLNYVLEDNFIIHPEGKLAFDDPKSMEDLERLIVEHNIKMVGIDPLYSLADAEDHFAGVGRQIQQTIKRLRHEYGVTFVFVHHNRKSGGSGRDAIYGSALLNAAIEGALVFQTKDGDSGANKTFKLLRSGKAFDEAYKADVQMVISTKEAEERFDVFITEQDATINAHEEEVLGQLANGSSLDARTIARDSSDSSPAQINKAIANLLDTGKIVESTKGNKTVYTIVLGDTKTF